MLLVLNRVHSYYEKSHILHGVSMNVNQGEMVCLLGRNGVGKSTTLKSIMGLVQPKEGSILFKDENLVGKEPYQIARIGIGYVPEERRIFRSLTTHENLLMGIKGGKRSKKRPNHTWTIDKIYQAFPKLEQRKGSKGAYLSGGEQQMLTVARTLMGNPKLILIDEPTEGLAPLVVKDVLGMLSRVLESGVSILMVEQNYKAAIRIADRFYVMSKGQIFFEGDGQALMKAEDIRKNYLEV
ncbi:MAG TPA: ABC transporter ATP-binding protein [Deltaproteobacteria bacterium]|nr:ABC transporter ATP-binding protein [Deltaproteobacteria bacterium]HDH98850.1 ABC transporter ATP-binding protein [Deltaproteobacteria bacterium]